MSKISPLLIGAVAFQLFLGCTVAKKEKQPAQNYMVSKKLDQATLEKGWAILEKAQQMADSGKSMNEVLALLPKNVEIMLNDNSLVYFLEGSVPMLVSFDKESKTTKGGGSASATLKVQVPKSLTASISSPIVWQSTYKTAVVGAERNEKDRQTKKALLLSALPKTFMKHDDVIDASEYLSDQNNYADNIEYRSQNLSLENYSDWQGFDLVHLSAHGQHFCGYPFKAGDKIKVITAGESNYCGTVIQSGVMHNLTSKEEVHDFYLDPKNIDYVGTVILAKEEFYLKTSFFEQFYRQADLKNKVWVFSACEMGQRSDMVTAIQSILKDSHFLYWLNAVEAKDTQPVFQNFYKNLALEGLDVQKAFEKIPLNLRKILPNLSEEEKDTTTIDLGTELLHLKTGNARHGIEVVQLLHPSDESILKEGVNYPLEGDFGDGEPETLVVKLDLLGYTFAEFQEQGMTLTLKVDDLTVLNQFSFLPDDPNDAVSIKKIPGKEYGIRLHFEGLEIPDLSEEKETMELKAYLHFNGDDFSIHSEVVNINPKDVKIHAKTPEGSLTITYDNDSGGLKFQAAQIPGGHTFSDDKGYMYVNKPNQGWKKLNLNNFMGQNMANMMGQVMPISMDVDILLGRDGISAEMPDVPQGNTIFKPMVDWPEKMTIAKLSRSPNFKKQEMDCLAGKGKCVAFTGLSGDAKGVQIYFNGSGKLERIMMKGHRLDYEYGDYTVVLPRAQELKLPF